MSNRSRARFIYSPATYPRSPLAGEWVFILGKLEEKQTNGNEIRLRVRDEKGIWEGYGFALSPELETGKKVRGYGQLKAQPDGNMQVALQWAKEINEEEMLFCEKQTQLEWEKMVVEYSVLPLLTPFEPKLTATIQKPLSTKPPQSEEFISANELQIERDYV